MNRGEHLKWVLERQLQWIGAADQKLTILTPISLSILASLVVTDRQPVEGLTSAAFPFWVALILASASVLFSFSTLVPRIQGPAGSRLFFGGVANFSEQEYQGAVLAETEDGIIQDLVAQIHINAVIARTKHRALARATHTLCVAIPFWGAFFAFTS